MFIIFKSQTTRIFNSIKLSSMRDLNTVMNKFFVELRILTIVNLRELLRVKVIKILYLRAKEDL